MQISKLVIQGELSCDNCHKEFKEKSVLKRHLSNVHSVPKPCTFCGKLLKIKGRIDSLRCHLNRCVMFERHLGTNDKNIIYNQALKFSSMIFSQFTK